MKKALLFVLVAVLFASFTATAVTAKKDPCLPAPVDISCVVEGDGAITVSLFEVPDADKYSVDVESDDGLLELSYSTDEPSFVVPSADLAGACGMITVKAKGLNPPMKGACSQNNPFAECGLINLGDCPPLE